MMMPLATFLLSTLPLSTSVPTIDLTEISWRGDSFAAKLPCPSCPYLNHNYSRVYATTSVNDRALLLNFTLSHDNTTIVLNGVPIWPPEGIPQSVYADILAKHFTHTEITADLDEQTCLRGGTYGLSYQSAWRVYPSSPPSVRFYFGINDIIAEWLGHWVTLAYDTAGLHQTVMSMVIRQTNPESSDSDTLTWTLISARLEPEMEYGPWLSGLKSRWVNFLDCKKGHDQESEGSCKATNTVQDGHTGIWGEIFFRFGLDGPRDVFVAFLMLVLIPVAIFWPEGSPARPDHGMLAKGPSRDERRRVLDKEREVAKRPFDEASDRMLASEKLMNEQRRAPPKDSELARLPFEATGERKRTPPKDADVARIPFQSAKDLFLAGRKAEREKDAAVSAEDGHLWETAIWESSEADIDTEEWDIVSVSG